jgi:pyruvate kinase
VIPAIVPDNHDVEALFREASLIAFRKGIVNRGDTIAFIVGIPVGVPGTPCNTIRIAKVELPDTQILRVQSEKLSTPTTPPLS